MPSPADPHAAAPVDRLRLCGRLGGDAVAFVPRGDEVRVGGAADNDLRLAAQGVSRHHARLSRTGGGWRLEDLGSKNGSFVNGRRVEGRPVAVGDGDELRFGPVTLHAEHVAAGDVDLAFELSWEEPDGAAEAPPTTTRLLTGEARPAAAGAAAEPLPDLAFPAGYRPGESPAMRLLYGQLAALADSDLPLLVVGETGSGKEPLARTLHRSSPRRRGPFVAVNCAAIPAELLEAEMFGIGHGVATGVEARRGRLEEAAGGTLLLDEVGDMPLPLQAKLLRALQERVVEPLGRPARPLDARVVAATNQDLEARIDDGSLRRDLYYRLAGAVLRVPPLRHRPGDLPALVGHFLTRFTGEAGKRLRGLTVRTLERLQAHRWPGNVRELENEIRRLVQLCPDGGAIDSAMLAEHVLAPPPEPAEDDPGLAATLELAAHTEALERRLIRRALERTGGNQTRAAKLLGLSRNGLANRIRRLGIEV
jgi:transcriptional regulator with AAA-type ATPase domain